MNIMADNKQKIISDIVSHHAEVRTTAAHALATHEGFRKLDRVGLIKMNMQTQR